MRLVFGGVYIYILPTRDLLITGQPHWFECRCHHSLAWQVLDVNTWCVSSNLVCYCQTIMDDILRLASSDEVWSWRGRSIDLRLSLLGRHSWPVLGGFQCVQLSHATLAVKELIHFDFYRSLQCASYGPCRPVWVLSVVIRHIQKRNNRKVMRLPAFKKTHTKKTFF